jgi:putative inorganic carbon (hco3(-)) transporter
MDRIAALATVILSAVTVVLTGSRTSFLLLAMLLVAFGLTRKRAVLAMPALIVLALIGWAFVPDSLKERYISVKDVASHKEVDQSYENRLIAWSAGRAMFMDYPVFGVGTGQFVNANGNQYWPRTPRLWLNAHNLYVQLLAEHGITGIVGWSVFIVILLVTTRRVKSRLAQTDEPGWLRHLPAAVQFSLFVLFVAGYSSHSLYRPTWYMLAALLGALQYLLAEPAQSPAPEGSVPASAQAVTA